MQKISTIFKAGGIIFLIIPCLFSVTMSSAQQTTMKDFVIFGGNSSAATGYVQLGSSSSVQGGYVGSYKLVKTTGSTTINANINSGGTITLANSNVVSGKITAANSPVVAGTILSVGSSTNLGSNIDVNGNIVIGGGTVSGIVTHPSGTTYSGPAIGTRNVTGTPTLPILPQMAPITVFSPFQALPDINSTRSITPDAYDDIRLSGNKTLTFSGTGVYVFDLISNTGGTNNFVFDFQNNTTGVFKIYIHNNVSLGKINVSMINGGSATRIFTEVHGTASGCFSIENGSSSNAASKWLGTVWAPYGSINVGSGTGNSTITGALWSGTQVNIQSGVNIIYAPFSECTLPNANAGIDKPLNFSGQTTLTGSSTTSGVTLSWQAIAGGVISSPLNAATISVTASGSYILTATTSEGCFARDTAMVTAKVNSLIGSELESVFQNFNIANPVSPFFLISNDSIMIDVIVKEGQYSATFNLLTNQPYGLSDIMSNGGSAFIITGMFKISKLPSLNLLSSYIDFVRPYYKPLFKSGIVSSAGDATLRSNLVRSGYQLQGQGVKIGVMSNSYKTITTATTSPFITNTESGDIGNGDLPGPTNPEGNLIPVHVVKDYPFKSTDEGRAMLQIVHDIAPKAELYFRTGFITAGDFAKGITDLRDSGCNVIVDDLTYITEPFLKDGTVAQAVDAVAATGTSYFSAAGNFANKSYENVFNAVSAPVGLTGTAHDFGGGDLFQSVTFKPGKYIIVLQWLDDIYSLGQTSAGGTKHDLDIYLTPNTDGTALVGYNRNNVNGDPIEFILLDTNLTTTTNIYITNKTTGSNPARFKYIIISLTGDPSTDITFNQFAATGNSTIVGQANAAGAIAVGAVRYDKAPPFASPVVETFSSFGGTVMGAAARNKPELVAPDGVNTTVKMGQDFDAGSTDGYSNFFGTSAAAPHAAAVAALIMEGKKKFSNQLLTAPAEIRSILQSTATDLYTAGFDFQSGYGFINADSAMRTFAKPDPTLIQLVVPSSVPIPGVNSFILTITGLNISPTSVIKFRDSTLVTTYINSTTATAVIPQFIGNPSISVYTPPISSSGLDGGSSDTLKFFNTIKKNIKVIANNITKKYAQQMPALTATIVINGDTTQTNLLTTDSLTNLGLGSLNLSTLATANSNTGTYIITTSRVFDASNPVDIGYKELYNYAFVNGSVTIEKLPVTVKANDATVVYGEKIPDITFTYQFNPANIPDPTAFLQNLQTAHENQIAKDALGDDILGIVNGQAVTIVNGQAIPIVNGQAVTIVNGQAVTIVNGQAVTIVNGQAVTIVNGQAVTIVNNLTENQVQNLSFLASTPSIQAARQITNKKLVNGIYETSSTQVVDITQESVLRFNTNSAQTTMLTSISQTSPKGLIDNTSFANGQAITIVNGQAVTIVNGQAVTIVNGQAVTIVNGQAVTIVNGQAIPIVNSQDKTAVVLNQSEIGQGQSPLKSLNMITGITVGDQFIIPGSFLNENLQITHIAGKVTILPATVTITPTAGQTKVYGDNDPVFTYTNNAGLTSGDFTGALGRNNGTNVGDYGFTLGTLSAGNNYSLVLESGNSFAITARPVTITPATGQSKVYGSNDPVFSYTASEALQQGDSYTGALSRASGESVANSPYAFTLGNLSAGNNYTLTLGGSNTFAITKKQISITPTAGQSKIYGSIDPAFTYTASESLQPGDAYTGALERIPGETVAGSPYAYTLGSLSAGNNYTLILGGTNTFEITKKQVDISPTVGQNKVYGSNDPVFTFTNNAGLTAGQFTGTLSRISGNNVGNYAFTIGSLSAGNNYSLSLAGAVTFSITKATLQIKAADKFIFKGDALPVFTSTITGLTNGDNPTVTYTLSPACTGAAGLYSIIPSISAFANSVNYTITYTNGTFYINPKGTGADDVDVYLECVEDRGSSYSPANRRYVARFYAKNLNTTPVYVPIGTNNKLTSAGSFDGSQQPVVFLQGTGTTKFSVPFDGVSLKWDLKTYEVNTIVTESVTASSSSKKCATTTYTRSANPEITEPAKVIVPETLPGGNVHVYPNPAKDMAVIYFANQVISEKELKLYDSYGRSYPIIINKKMSNGSVELDLSLLLKGIYFVKVKTGSGTKSVSIIKE